MSLCNCILISYHCAHEITVIETYYFLTVCRSNKLLHYWLHGSHILYELAISKVKLCNPFSYSSKSVSELSWTNVDLYLIVKSAEGNCIAIIAVLFSNAHVKGLQTGLTMFDIWYSHKLFPVLTTPAFRNMPQWWQVGMNEDLFIVDSYDLR